jgi:hypothetical protein
MYRIICWLFSTVLLVAWVATASSAATEEDSDKDTGIQYRLLGPAAGGRTTRVVGIPGEPLTYYLATASGGVWKSSNGGTEWKSVFDDQPVSSIGSVTVRRSQYSWQRWRG